MRTHEKTMRKPLCFQGYFTIDGETGQNLRLEREFKTGKYSDISVIQFSKSPNTTIYGPFFGALCLCMSKLHLPHGTERHCFPFTYISVCH